MPGFIDRLFDDIPDDEVQQTKALGHVAEMARNLWKTDPGSPDLSLLAQRVGDFARAEPNRAALGESGLLEFFCSVVSTRRVRSALIAQCLRIIGNSSADKDENRARVVASNCLPSIVSFLNDDSILAFVIPVLFNISVDYEPAQKAIYQAGINPELVSLISGPRLDDAAVLLNYICKLLGFVATQEPKASLVHPGTPFVLLNLANNQPLPLDAKDFLGLASVALTYLAQEQFQKVFLETPGAVSLIFQAFSRACEEFEASLEHPDDEAQLKQVQAAFTATLADLSAHPLFALSCSLDGPEVQTLQRWVSVSDISLQSAACLALGNIARSDEKCCYLVQQCAIHEPLIAILTDPRNVDAGLLHAVLGFLKNLAIPAENKAILGSAGLLETGVLPRIWGLDTQTQVQFDAVSLSRLLLVGCHENVRRICAPVSEDSSSSTQSRSKLHLLMDLNARSDQEPTQMETARAITAVCRVLHSSADSSPVPQSKVPTDSAPELSSSTSYPTTSLETFYSDHHTITDSMVRLGLQSKFPVLRSELLFVFALMARAPAGAAAVARSMHRPELVDVVVEMITGEKPAADGIDGSNESESETPTVLPAVSSDIGQVAGLEAQAPATSAGANVATATGARKTMQEVDRENALVLIAELLRQCPDELPPASRRAFQNLLREGGQRLLQERAAQGPAGDSV